MYNKITKIAITLIIIMGMQSCDDYLEILPEGQENSENFFNTEQDYQDALVGVYDLLSTTYLNNILGEIASDNSFCGGESPTDVLDWQQIDDMTHTADNGALRNIFQWMYAGISRANYIVEFQDKTDFEGKDTLLAENLFLRAYFYFELTKFFGDVPFYIDGRITIEETQAIDRTPKADIYAQLEIDLMNSIPLLPWQQSQAGRATKGAAWALLGKIYLFQEKYTEAAQAFNQIINSGQYQLVDNFATIFLNSNENNQESVFEIQYSGGQEGASFGCFQCVEGNVAVGFMGPRFRGGNFAPYASGFSFNIPVQQVVDLYQAADTRLAATILDIDAFVAARPDVIYNEGSEHTGYFNLKYIPYADDNVLQDVNINRSNNYRAIRYADILLMAAEANLRAPSPIANPQTFLDAIRDRAFGNTSNRIPATLENVLQERRRELAGEGHRFFDQVRTGQTSTISGFTPGKNEIFPIPRIEIELAGNRWIQNSGY